jgi:hypothetical protein
VINSLKGGLSLSNFTIRNVDIVGPKVGAQLRRQAILATLYALAGMLVYIAFRFEWVYGAAAVIAVFHDVLITLGFFSLFHYEISLTVIAALLTLVGYSMNDTIVIFDRVREKSRLMRRESFTEIVNKSINQTLSRTILTSGLTFPDGPGSLHHGRRGSACFLLCHGGGSCGRNVLQFWHRSADRGLLEQAMGAGHHSCQQVASSSGVRAGSAADKRVVAAARR